MTKNDELKTYEDWKVVYENSNNIVILDDDGGRGLYREGRLDELMTYKEALKYLLICTIVSKSE